MAAPVRVAVSGASGRMGQAILSLIERDDGLELAGGIARSGGDESAGPAGGRALPLDAAAELLGSADVLIDVSAPAFLRALLETHGGALGSAALVVGTTGLGPEEERLIRERAARGAVLTAANFSVGVNVLLSLVERAAAALEGYDVEIVEAHHRRKEDAPSGTALALGEAVASARSLELDTVRRDGRSGRTGARTDREIGFHALRGGDVVGEHQVVFLGDMDRVEIAHRATDRTLFAAGALRAARWMAGRAPGRYTMRDVLGLT